jgi:hypothetical protein
MYKTKKLKLQMKKHQVTYKVTLIKITPGFSTENLKARRVWADALWSLRDYRCQQPVKLSVTINGESKIFHDKTKLK